MIHGSKIVSAPIHSVCIFSLEYLLENIRNNNRLICHLIPSNVAIEILEMLMQVFSHSRQLFNLDPFFIEIFETIKDAENSLYAATVCLYLEYIKKCINPSLEVIKSHFSFSACKAPYSVLADVFYVGYCKNKSLDLLEQELLTFLGDCKDWSFLYWFPLFSKFNDSSKIKRQVNQSLSLLNDSFCMSGMNSENYLLLLQTFLTFDILIQDELFTQFQVIWLLPWMNLMDGSSSFDSLPVHDIHFNDEMRCASLKLLSKSKDNLATIEEIVIQVAVRKELDFFFKIVKMLPKLLRNSIISK